ncbi:MAG: UPF0149 family protein [Betaproteobacteria bacterium]|nr:UPF0149 family protein [Betaproteobacteria bacterium]
MNANLNSDLTEAELNALDDFLAGPEVGECGMDLSTMEGFFAALALGPRMVPPSEWLPWVWDAVLGEVEPEFENADDGMRMSTLVLRRYNAVVGSLLDNPAGFMPLYERGDRWGTTEWCEGFLLGTTLDEDSRDRLGAAHPDWIAAFERLGTEAGIDRILEDDDAERWIAEIVPALAKIHAHWADARAAQPGRVPEAAYDVGGAPHEPAMRTAPKVGRNDPCPCGSGKKYKKCCMAKDMASP